MNKYVNLYFISYTHIIHICIYKIYMLFPPPRNKRTLHSIIIFRKSECVEYYRSQKIDLIIKIVRNSKKYFLDLKRRRY